jgi:hypothetical protein
MCERKPPPDNIADEGDDNDDEEKVKDKDKKDKVGRTKDDKQTSGGLLDPDESIIPQSSKDSNITATTTNGAEP